MAAPFPEAQLEPLIYTVLGFLMALVVVLVFYVRRLQERLDGEVAEETEQFEIDKIGLSKRSEDVLGAVLEEPLLQSELPDELKVSKATVSNAVNELFERNLVKKRRKANTYLIEPRVDEIRRQRR